LCEVKFIIVVKILDICLDSFLGCQHTIISYSIFFNDALILGHLFKSPHLCLESHFSFLNVLSSELAGLQLGVDFVSLIILEVKKFFINQSGIKTSPTWLERIVLNQIIKMLNLQVVIIAILQLDIQELRLVILFSICIATNLTIFITCTQWYKAIYKKIKFTVRKNRNSLNIP